MPIATNPQTGETVYLTDDGQWAPARIAENPQTGERLAFDGQSWQAVKSPKAKKDDVGMGVAAREGFLSGATANLRDEAYGLSEASGLPRVLGGFRAPVGAARLGYEYLTGQPGEATRAYDAGVAEKRALQERAAEQYPGTTLAAGLAGAVALPVGAGARAATLGARAARGAATGAGIGTVAGFGAGEGLPESATKAAGGALLGGAVGAAAPPIIEGVTRGVTAAAAPVTAAIRGLRDPAAEAARRVGSAVQRARTTGEDVLTEGEFAAERAAGSPVSVVDMAGTPGRAMARSAANTSPEARAALERATHDRYEGQSGRVSAWLNDAFSYPNAHAQQQAIDQVENTVNRAAYRRAYSEGDRQIWSPELERLTSSPDVVAAMRDAATKGKSRAVTQGFGGFNPGVTVDNGGIVTFQRGPTGQPTYPNLQFWDYTKRALDDARSAAARAGRNEEAGYLGQLSRQLRAELDNLVPSYGNARSVAARFFGAENALEAGQNFVTQNFANREVRAQLARMSETERNLFRDGFVSRLVETLNATNDRTNILNRIAGSPQAREKIEIALGRERAAELEMRLRVENIMDRMRNALGNSTTARQLIESGLAGGALGGLYTGDLSGAGQGAAMFATMRLGARAINQRIDERVARRVGEMLASGDAAVVNRGIAMLARSPTLTRVVRSADNATAKFAPQQTTEIAPRLLATGRAEDDDPAVPGPIGQ